MQNPIKIDDLVVITIIFGNIHIDNLIDIYFQITNLKGKFLLIFFLGGGMISKHTEIISYP